MFDFEQNMTNKNYLDFYSTVYIASDVGTDLSHTDSDRNMQTSTPLSNRRQPFKRISDRIHTPLRLHSPIALSSNGIFCYDDL